MNDVQIASTFGDNGQQLPEIPTTTFWISHAMSAFFVVFGIITLFFSSSKVGFSSPNFFKLPFHRRTHTGASKALPSAHTLELLQQLRNTAVMVHRFENAIDRWNIAIIEVRCKPI